MHVTEFSAAPLPHPMRFQEVEEGHFAAAALTPEVSHLATFGIFTCKALSLYNRNTQAGLLAHIDGTAHPERIISTIVDKYPGDITEAEASIVQNVQDEFEMLWPTADTLAKILMEYGPRNLRIDRNPHEIWRRNTALCLATGEVYEAGYTDEIGTTSERNPLPSIPLRTNDLQL